MRWIKFVGVSLLFVGLLSACMTLAQVKRRVTEALGSLPSPSGAELLVQEFRSASGSQDECLGAAYFLIYGARDPFDEVLSAYRQKLLEAGWEDVSEHAISPAFAKEGGYTLWIEKADVERALLLVGRKYQTILESRAGEFQTLFMIIIAFSTCSGVEG